MIDCRMDRWWRFHADAFNLPLQVIRSTGGNGPNHLSAGVVEVSRLRVQPSTPRSRIFEASFAIRSLVVEVPGIEPGSSSTDIKLLRA